MERKQQQCFYGTWLTVHQTINGVNTESRISESWGSALLLIQWIFARVFDRDRFLSKPVYRPMPGHGPGEAPLAALCSWLYINALLFRPDSLPCLLGSIQSRHHPNDKIIILGSASEVRSERTGAILAAELVPLKGLNAADPSSSDLLGNWQDS